MFNGILLNMLDVSMGFPQVSAPWRGGHWHVQCANFWLRRTIFAYRSYRRMSWWHRCVFGNRSGKHVMKRSWTADLDGFGISIYFNVFQYIHNVLSCQYMISPDWLNLLFGFWRHASCSKAFKAVAYQVLSFLNLFGAILVFVSSFPCGKTHLQYPGSESGRSGRRVSH